MEKELARVAELRRNQEFEQAYLLMQTLYQQNPKDPTYNYQLARCCDNLGKEKEAISYYETAIREGLEEGLVDAYIGLGSSYRALGRYEEARTTFETALDAFPDNLPLKAFASLTAYNLGESHTAVSTLLTLLLNHVADESLQSYGRALCYYGEHLDEVVEE